MQARATAERTLQKLRTSIRDLFYHRGRYRHRDGCRAAPKVRQRLLAIQWVKERKVKQHRMPEPIAPSLQPLTHQLVTISSPLLGDRISQYQCLQYAVLMVSGFSMINLHWVIHHCLLMKVGQWAIHQGLPSDHYNDEAPPDLVTIFGVFSLSSQ